MAEQCDHDWVMFEAWCETCGGHDVLVCQRCDDAVDQYTYSQRDRWDQIVASGNWNRRD